MQVIFKNLQPGPLFVKKMFVFTIVVNYNENTIQSYLVFSLFTELEGYVDCNDKG